jgi:hypothetical protein
MGAEKKDLAGVIKMSIRQLQQGIDILGLGTLRKNLIQVLIETN